MKNKDDSRNAAQSVTLLETIEEYQFDALIGGARRDEEKARAKERIFSFRDEFGQWDPKNQRPELWDLFNTHIDKGEHIRVFPISDHLGRFSICSQPTLLCYRHLDGSRSLL